jgi:hypothetical protein
MQCKLHNARMQCWNSHSYTMDCRCKVSCQKCDRDTKIAKQYHTETPSLSTYELKARQKWPNWSIRLLGRSKTVRPGTAADDDDANRRKSASEITRLQVCRCIVKHKKTRPQLLWEWERTDDQREHFWPGRQRKGNAWKALNPSIYEYVEQGDRSNHPRTGSRD